MSKPTEHKTVQAHILAFAEKWGGTFGTIEFLSSGVVLMRVQQRLRSGH